MGSDIVTWIHKFKRQKKMFHISSIGAQQKKKKMAEKITKKDENVKPVLLQSQLILKPDNKNLKEGVD